MADFNLGREAALLNEYINCVQGRYIAFIRKNNIDWNDIDNKYIAAYEELNDIERSRHKLKTEDDIRKANTRIKELGDKIK